MQKSLFGLMHFKHTSDSRFQQIKFFRRYLHYKQQLFSKDKMSIKRYLPESTIILTN